MKNIVIITLLISLLSFSCSDFLKEDYLSGENSETITSSEAGMESLVAASYIFLRAWYGKENQWDLTESGTDLYTWGLDNRSKGFCTYTSWVGEEQDRMAAMWYELYTALNSCNLAIRDIDNISYKDSLVQLNRKGELHFLRAHYLWMIVENWGPVHFMLDPIEEAVHNANKTPVSDFYEQIFLDLETSLEFVPEITAEYGRITEPVTRAFLARAHLMWASYLKNGLNISGEEIIAQDAGQSQIHYDKALVYANELIDHPDYELLGDWEEIWSIENIKNNEIIWAVNYSNDPVYTASNLVNPWDDDGGKYNSKRAIQREGGHQGHLMWEIRYENLSWGMVRDVANGRGFQRWLPTRFFLELYDENLDQRFFGSFKNVWYANDEGSIPQWRPFIYIDEVRIELPQEKWMQPMFEVGDTAIYFSKTPIPSSKKAKLSKKDIYYIHPDKGYYMFDINDMYNADGSPNDGVINRQYYFPITKKYMDDTRVVLTTQYSQRDAYVLRLSEMYLIAAEAAMETGDATGAMTYLESLANSRSNSEDGAALLAAYGINTGDDITTDYILDERARELATEGLRFWDLKRTGKLVERISAHNTDAAPNIREHHQLRFIPQEQLDAVRNKDVFTQNPGY